MHSVAPLLRLSLSLFVYVSRSLCVSPSLSLNLSISIALCAFQNALKTTNAKDDVVKDGFTPVQRFFLPAVCTRSLPFYVSLSLAVYLSRSLYLSPLSLSVLPCAPSRTRSSPPTQRTTWFRTASPPSSLSSRLLYALVRSLLCLSIPCCLSVSLSLSFSSLAISIALRAFQNALKSTNAKDDVV